MNGKYLCGIVLVILLGIGLYPRDTTVTPEWEVRVVDGSGQPISGATVRHAWRDYSLEASWHEEYVTTDGAGYVRLPRHSLRSNFVRRSIGTFKRLWEEGLFATVGPQALLIVHKDGYWQMMRDHKNWRWNVSEETMASVFVLRRCDGDSATEMGHAECTVTCGEDITCSGK